MRSGRYCTAHIDGEVVLGVWPISTIGVGLSGGDGDRSRE